MFTHREVKQVASNVFRVSLRNSLNTEKSSFFVVNPSPATAFAGECACTANEQGLFTFSLNGREVLREIEGASGMKFTGLINNTNLGRETDEEVVLRSVSYGEAVASLMEIPLVMTTVPADLAQPLQGKIENLFPLELQKKLIRAETELEELKKR